MQINKKIYFVILLLILILIVSFALTCSKESSSPEATVKAFYKAINDGDISEAEKYVSLETSLGDLGLASDDFSFDSENPGLSREEKIQLLRGTIKKIEIEDKQIEKAFGIEQAILVIKVILKPGVREEAESKFEEERNKPLISRDITVISINGFLSGFPENQKCFLEKYDTGWKICYFE